MLTLLALTYGATWLIAGVCAAVVEGLRLVRLRPLPQPIDVVGALALAWVSAPVMGPYLVLLGVRRLTRRVRE